MRGEKLCYKDDKSTYAIDLMGFNGQSQSPIKRTENSSDAPENNF